MGKTQKGGSGFSASKPNANLKQQIARNDPDHTAKEKQALALINQGKLQEAEAIYRELIAAEILNEHILSNLAGICNQTGRADTSIELITQALEINPASGTLHSNLGMLLLDHKEDAGPARHHCEKAIELSPDNPSAHLNLANALLALGNNETAIRHYQKSIELQPSSADAWKGIGNALAEAGDITSAIDAYTKALSLNHASAEAQANMAMARLLIGDYRNGWVGYEHRFSAKSKLGILFAKPDITEWRGSQIDPKTKLLLVGEQGLGDTLHFMRYAIALRNQGIQLSLCAQPNLHLLIQASGIDTKPLTPAQANVVTEGLWIPLLSIPRHLWVSPENPIITEPYIKTTDELISKWRRILAGEKRPIIGLNWQGNPDHEKTNSKGRSLPLKTFAPIAQRTNASLLSLQKGFGSEQLQTCSFKDRFVSCQPQIDETWDFLETAAIIANCNLVITSDTSIAHLAGGMGKTTWLLLKKVPEWRWGLEGDTTFWYPSMRLFRQRERGNWDDVLQRVAEALQEVFPRIPTAG